MKKFMTVLLVIAVMFTFSFGSAFAADFEAGTAPDTISDGYFESLWTEYVKNTDIYDEFEISKSVLAGMKAEAKVVYDAHMKDATEYVKDLDGLKNVLKADNTKANAYRLAAAAAQFAADKADALAKFATVPTYNYSTEEIAEELEAGIKAITGKSADDKTYQEVAEMLVAAFVEDVEDCDDFDADVTVGAYKTASEDVAAIVETELYAMAYAVDGVVSLTGAYDLADAYHDVYTDVTGDPAVKYVSQTAKNFWSAETISVQGQVDAAGVAAKKAENAAVYAEYVVGQNAETVKKAAKWLKVADIRAEEGAEIGEVDATLENYADRADKIAALEAYAAKVGAEKNADGELIRDAAVVKAELEKGIVNIATEDDAAAALNAAKRAIDAAVDAVVADKLAFVKESAVKATELYLEDAEADEVYFAAEFAKVQAKIAAYVAKIEAAKTQDDVAELLYDLQEAIDDIDTADDVRGYCTGKWSEAVTALVEYAEAYVEYYEAGITDTDAEKVTDKLEARIVEMIGESGLRTSAEIKKLTEEATAVAQGLPTVEEVKAAKKAVKVAVEALPTKITVDSLAQVQAAAAAQKAYGKLTNEPSGYEGAIATAVDNLETAYNTSFVKAAATVAKTDEAAVKALRSEIKAAIKTLKALGEEVTEYLDTLVETLDRYLTAIRTAEYEAVEDAINAIPLNVTEADKAVVVKARELYDAYVAKYTSYTALYYQEYDEDEKVDYLAGYVADDFNPLLSDLTAAETVLGLHAEDPAYSVEALKITASSKATKGAITVKWSVKGDTSAVEGYEIWKSTKRNSGYKKAFTATKMSYKNTKGLKKGTRYFYKVRAIAYTAEGVKVKSDWSNKAYRVAK